MGTKSRVAVLEIPNFYKHFHDKFQLFEDLEFGGVLGAFLEGFGAPESTNLPLCSTFFRTLFPRLAQEPPKPAPQGRFGAPGVSWFIPLH